MKISINGEILHLIELLLRKVSHENLRLFNEF